VNLNTQQVFAPERKASLGIQYELPLGLAGTLTPRVDGTYQSEFFTAIDNNPDGQVDGYTLLNARVTWQSSSGDWSGAFALTNATDKFYYLNKFRQGPPFNFVIGQPGRPREWSVSIKRTF
jgi:iron complex outermembrane receptor protein